ncbi:uncharacterized protein LOC143080128 isoform X2 [Mytilus galloprovincialis]|uniref:uncharacterized protein LOC143080128 isoform X2 n=1 Tax=Mytilus galloprovincialis TaxID=29158 RepID=UPI003F7C4825
MQANQYFVFLKQRMNITKALIIYTVALFQTVTLSIAAVQTTVATMSNPQENSSVPTSTTNYITEQPCFDKLNNCGDYGNDVCLGIFHSWAFENCKRHCGMCYTTVQKGCHDKEPTICTSKRDVICTDAAYKAYAEVYCQKTCNLCPGHKTQTPKYCTFHGTKYPHGYQWTNGCDKKCTCDNGRFNCIDLCQRIISVFRLKCCHPEFIIRYLFPGVCSYGGQTYKQDERWFDGCKFACVCEDAMIGQYKCYNLDNEKITYKF